MTPTLEQQLAAAQEGRIGYNVVARRVSPQPGRRPQMNPATIDDSIIPWRKFFASFEIGDPAECWEWWGSKNPDGYGAVRIYLPPPLKRYYAHRLSFTFFNGPIPENHLVCHRCDNPGCVNPAHLFAGTVRENWLDLVAKGMQSPARGERQGKAKLTEQQVREIRRRHRTEGVGCRRMAKQYGVGQTAITKILRRETWEGVEDEE